MGFEGLDFVIIFAGKEFARFFTATELVDGPSGKRSQVQKSQTRVGKCCGFEVAQITGQCFRTERKMRRWRR